MRKLIEAVGTVLKQDGYTGLGVNMVAWQAGIDKKQIYRYFSNFNNLVETFITERDFWMVMSAEIKEALKSRSGEQEFVLIGTTLEQEMEFFYREVEMQKIIHWQISEPNALLRSISNARESMGEDMLRTTDPHLQGSDVNFRSVCALLVGGIYYTVLHARSNGSTVCGINLNDPMDREVVIKTIKQIICWSYQAARKDK